ncbi:MAG TPA: DUF3592 domain-containing protein [Roseomonas sp.]|jgi:hypothetical protein
MDDPEAEEPPVPSRMGQRMYQPSVLSSVGRVCLVMLVMGAFPGVPGVISLMRERDFLQHATAHADAVVSGMVNGTSRAGTHHWAVYTFRTEDGREVEAVGQDAWASGPVAPLHAQVPVRYDPANPRQVQADWPSARWGDAWFWGSATVLFLVLAMAPDGWPWLQDLWLAFRLRRRGIVVEAKVDQIIWVPLQIRGKEKPHRWQIKTIGVLEGPGFRFECRSALLVEDPRPYIGPRGRLPVLIDPQEPERALLIAEFLPLPRVFGLRRRADAVWAAWQQAARAG